MKQPSSLLTQSVFLVNPRVKVFLTSFILTVLSIFPAQSQSQIGAHTVGYRDLNFVDGTLATPNVNVRVYYPAVATGVNQAPEMGSFPSIAFGHGFNLDYLDYENLCEHLASHGYIVITPDVQNGFNVNHQEYARELAACISYMQNQGAAPSSDFYTIVAPESGVYGHSMGGGASFLVPNEFSEIDAICGLAAAETNPSAVAALGTYSGPFMVISGSEDNTAPPATNQELMYTAASGPKMHVSLTGGAHCKFTDASTICDLVSSAGSISRAQQQKLANRYTTAFFDYFLKNNSNSLTFLCGDSLVADVNGSIVSYEREQIVCVTTLEDENLESDWVVFPNPSDGLLRIEGIEMLTLKDNSGKTIRQLVGSSDGIEVDLSELPTGMYWICVEGMTVMQKWMKR